jgi:hypothetical protein
MVPIKYFRVRAIYTYDNYVDDGAEVGTGPLGPGQSNDSFIGMGSPSLAHDNPVGQLRGITLIPSLLEFEDGRKWRQPFIHEPRSKMSALPISACSGLASERPLFEVAWASRQTLSELIGKVQPFRKESGKAALRGEVGQENINFLRSVGLLAFIGFWNV